VEGLPLGVIGDLSGWALAGLLFVLMATGRLVSVRTLEREQRLLEQVADNWRAAHDTEAAQLSVILEELRRVRTSTREPAA
jgi:hypothetical protein